MRNNEMEEVDMTTQTSSTPALPVIDSDFGNITGKVIVCVGARNVPLEMAAFGLTMESSEDQILAEVQGVIAENLSDDLSGMAFTARKMVELGGIMVIPKPTAG